MKLYNYMLINISNHFLIREAAPRIKNIAALIAESIQRWFPDDTDKDNILRIRYRFIDIDIYRYYY